MERPSGPAACPAESDRTPRGVVASRGWQELLRWGGQTPPSTPSPFLTATSGPRRCRQIQQRLKAYYGPQRWPPPGKAWGSSTPCTRGDYRRSNTLMPYPKPEGWRRCPCGPSVDVFKDGDGLQSLYEWTKWTQHHLGAMDNLLVVPELCPIYRLKRALLAQQPARHSWKNKGSLSGVP